MIGKPCPDRVERPDPDDTSVLLTPDDVSPFLGRYVTIWYPIPEEEYQVLCRELRDAEHVGYVPPPVGSMSGVLVEIADIETGDPELVVDWGQGIKLSHVSGVEKDVPEEGLEEYYASVIRLQAQGAAYERRTITRLWSTINHQRRALREAGRTDFGVGSQALEEGEGGSPKS